MYKFVNIILAYLTFINLLEVIRIFYILPHPALDVVVDDEVYVPILNAVFKYSRDIDKGIEAIFQVLFSKQWPLFQQAMSVASQFHVVYKHRLHL